MIDIFWLAIVTVLLVLMLWTNRTAYRHGIWDGAFNHFLPVVQKEMLYYDRDRATKLLRNEGIEF